MGGLHGLAQPGEAEAGRDDLAVDALFKDWTEEDGVKPGESGGACLCDRVAGDADEGLRQPRGVEGLPDALQFTLAGAAPEVDTIRAGAGRDGRGSVEEDFEGGARKAASLFDDTAEESLHGGFGEVAFAELEDVDPFGEEASGLRDKGVLPAGFVPRKNLPIRDGVSQHRQTILASAGAGGIIGVQALPPPS